MLQTLSQVDICDRQDQKTRTARTGPKILRKNKDVFSAHDHFVRFTKCVNATAEGTIVNHNPTHGHVQANVYCYKRVNEKRSKSVVRVPGINVILTSLPSESLKIPLVELINFKFAQGVNQARGDVYFYQKIVFDAIMALYREELRIVTSSTDFDVGCTQVGKKANEWFVEQFKLETSVHGVAVLRKGIL